jgi:hypothetical protein
MQAIPNTEGADMTSLTNFALGTVFAAASLAPVVAQDANRILTGQPVAQISRATGIGAIAPTLGRMLCAARAEFPHLFSSALSLASSESEGR